MVQAMRPIYKCNELFRLANRRVTIDMLFEALDRWARARWLLVAYKRRQKTAQQLASKGML